MTTRRSELCLKSFLPDVIFEKFKGPCGHDNPSFGIFAPNHFCRKSFLRNLKAPAGMTLVVRGFCPKSFLPDVIFEKFKGPCGHDNPRFGAFAPKHFCRKSSSQKTATLFCGVPVVFQKTYPKGRFSMLFGHNYFFNSAIRNFRRFNHTNSARRSRLKE